MAIQRAQRDNQRPKGTVDTCHTWSLTRRSPEPPNCRTQHPPPPHGCLLVLLSPSAQAWCVLGGPAAKGQPGYPPYFWACPRPPGKGRQQRGGFPSYYGQTLSPQSPGARPSQPFALLEVQNTRCDTACSPLGTLPQQHGSLPPRPTASSLQPLPANSVSSRH